MKRALALLFLSACAPYAPVFSPVDVAVPVAVPCRTVPVEKPDFALGHVSVSDDIAQKTKAALIELNQRRGYEAEIEAQIAACQ